MPNSLFEGKTAQDWINLVLAVCLFFSPWAVGFVTEATPAWNAWIVGIVLGALAVATLSVFAEWEEWAERLARPLAGRIAVATGIRRQRECDVDPCGDRRARRRRVGMGGLGTSAYPARARVSRPSS